MSQIPKARSSLEPQLEQVFPPKISYNFFCNDSLNLAEPPE